MPQLNVENRGLRQWGGNTSKELAGKVVKDDDVHVSIFFGEDGEHPPTWPNKGPCALGGVLPTEAFNICTARSSRFLLAHGHDG